MMYKKIKEEIKQQYYVQNYPNDGQRFVAWYVRNIHSLDENQTKYAITDGADDKQIDAVVIDENNSTVYIIQGKFIGADKVDAEPLREVLSSWVQLKDLIRLQETSNDKLKKRLVDLATALEEDYDIKFELITTPELTDAAKKDLAAFQQELGESEDFPAELILVDSNELQTRYDLALERENPVLKHKITLHEGKFVEMSVAGTNAIVAAVPLKDCLSFPGIKDGTLFQKNVRQSLGLNNRVNRGIKQTIYDKDHSDFFFYHNGVTAICNRMKFDKNNNTLEMTGLSVVNGCQSLNTILSCSEKVKEYNDTYIMFRFYEIPQRDRADKISISTNSQSTVKPRDLRSNDKKVLSLKKQFEQRYQTGYLKTKRGEEAPASKDQSFVLDLVDLGKFLISWQSQRPNTAYSETKIFDKYFEQLFKKEYKPENAQALNLWMKKIMAGWVQTNPFGLNESLLAMKAYAPYHQLYAVSMVFAIANNMPDGVVPGPSITWEKVNKENVADQIVTIAGACLNTALEAAASESRPDNRIFSPQNWIKSKSCLTAIRAAIRQYFNMLPTMPGGKEMNEKLKNALRMDREQFEDRWTAD